EDSQSSISSHITVTALNNDGTPVVGKTVVFQAPECCIGGYFDNHQISDTRITNSSGMAEINFYIEHTALMRCMDYMYINVTLEEADARYDNTMAQVTDTIPIKIISKNSQEGKICIGGYILTTAGIPVSEVLLTLDDGSTTVSQEDGSYFFTVYPGWTGTITPSLDNYIFTPASYTISSPPVISSRLDLNFIAQTDPNAVVNKLDTDITNWEAPANGGSQLVNVYNVSQEAAIDYIVLPNTNWIRVMPSSGTTPGNFTIFVSKNTTGHSRSGKVTVSATNTQSEEVVITIMQIVDGAFPSLAVNPSDIYAPASGNITYTVTVSNPTTSDVLDWTLDSDATWLAITPTSGDTLNNDTFTVKVQGVNPFNTDRVGRIYVTASNGAVAVVKVRQEKS
ncbi:MAG TPA: BACON domain-containing protein, partial [Candidatus Deferrimicrobium sp.]|nr:BACON domain-containing protein [Candidatus Deferrimicrobium sp.]